MKITVIPYDQQWNDIFLKEKSSLELIIGKTDIQIEHIGSTSISGMPAKPIIDILVGVPKMEYFSEIVSKLSQKEEYIYFKIYEKNINFRRFFLKLKLNKPIVYPNVIDYEFEGDIIPLEHRMCHIHVVPLNHEFWEIHIKFRDILINNPLIRSEYKKLKKDLSRQNWNSSKEYYFAKHNFIQSVLDKYI